MQVRALVVCSLALIAAVGRGAAQATSAVAPGARVRVWAPEWRNEAVTGTLVELGSDYVVVRPEGQAETLGVPRRAITSMYVSVGRTQRTGWGIKYGAVAGFVAGSLVGATVCAVAVDSCASSQQQEENQTLVYSIGGGFIGAGAGLLVGAIIGGRIRADRWERVPH